MCILEYKHVYDTHMKSWTLQALLSEGILVVLMGSLNFKETELS